MNDASDQHVGGDYIYLALDIYLNADDTNPIFGMCPVYRTEDAAKSEHPDSEIIVMRFFDAVDA